MNNKENQVNENTAADEAADELFERTIARSVQTATEARNATGEDPIPMKCDVPGHEDDVIYYKQTGWTFGHLMRFEDAVGTSKTLEIVAERIADWSLTDEKGNDIPFEPKELRKALEAVSEDQEPERQTISLKLKAAMSGTFASVPSSMMNFVFISFRTAYTVAGALPPKR